MRRVIVMVFVVLIFQIGITLHLYSSSRTQLQETVDMYSNAVSQEIPDSLRLTIYYLDADILTRVPLNPETLKTFPGTNRIIIESEELAKHIELLRKLNMIDMRPANGNANLNARMCYTFETEESGVLLEVAVNTLHGNVFVNNIEVENSFIFFEIIEPFLSEDIESIFGVK